jgi:Protein of unknown function (DUF2612)
MSIFDLVSIPVTNGNFETSTVLPVNGDFETSAALPPVNWQNTNLNPETLSYETVAPYAGVRSLIITATLPNTGVVTIAQIPVSAGQTITVNGAMFSVGGDQLVISPQFFDQNGNFLSWGNEVDSVATSWVLGSGASTVAPANTAYVLVAAFLRTVTGGGVGKFDAITLTIVGAAPPGWSLYGGTTVTFDASTPYEGLQSVVINATQQYGGIQTSTPFSVVPGQTLQLSAALRSLSGNTAVVSFAWYDVNMNFIGTGPEALATTSSTWLYQSFIQTIPFNAAFVYIALYTWDIGGGQVEFDDVTLFSNSAIPYYLGLITSEYQNSPKMIEWAQSLIKPLTDAAICAASMYQAFDINTAVGVQLDILGEILGVSRILTFTPTGSGVAAVSPYFQGGLSNGYSGANYKVGDVLSFNLITTGGTGATVVVLSVGPGVPGRNNAPWSYGVLTPGSNYIVYPNRNGGIPTTGGSGFQASVNIDAVVGNTVLDDNTYRILLKATIAKNQWNGQVDSLYAIWSSLFPGGQIQIEDNQNMTAFITVSGSFTSIISQLITNGFIIPRPQGVQYTITAGASLPMFGVDRNDQFIAGADTGKAT